jgi:hypothetical protein
MYGLTTYGGSVGGGAIYSFAPSVPCFAEGTKILCVVNGKDTSIAVETLKIGDLVRTYRHGVRKVEETFSGSMINNPTVWHSCMYTMPATSTTEAITVTGGHGFLVDRLTPAQRSAQTAYWVNGECRIDDKLILLASVDERFNKMEERKAVNYYHFVLENDRNNETRYGVYANGHLSETPSKNYMNSMRFQHLNGHSAPAIKDVSIPQVKTPRIRTSFSMFSRKR